MTAPAVSYALSGMLAPRPAPDWTVTECRPPWTSLATVSGVAATRVSPGRISAGMPMCMKGVGSRLAALGSWLGVRRARHVQLKVYRYVPLANVLHASMLPESRPRRSHLVRSSEEPCVKDSG